jgi:hypothetical protein
VLLCQKLARLPVDCGQGSLAIKLGFALPIVGPAITSAAGLSAFGRGLEDLGYDTLWVGDRLVTPVDMQRVTGCAGAQFVCKLGDLIASSQPRPPIHQFVSPERRTRQARVRPGTDSTGLFGTIARKTVEAKPGVGLAEMRRCSAGLRTATGAEWRN